MGLEREHMEFHTPTQFQDLTYARAGTSRYSSHHFTENDQNFLGTTWGNLENENFKGDRGHFKVTHPFWGHEFYF